MTERDRLLLAVIESPEDDAPRMIYADHLLEFGDAVDQERGEFIHRMIEQGPLCEYLADRDAVSQWAKNDIRVETWNAETHTHRVDYIEKITYRRGFVESVICKYEEFRHHGPSLVLKFPLKGVRASDREPLYWGSEYCWRGLDNERGRAVEGCTGINVDVWGLIEGGKQVDSHSVWKDFVTKEASWVGLSDAMLTWVRLKAGLD